MLKHSKSGPLKVVLLTISPHNRAILEFFFAGAGQTLFKVVNASDAEAFVLDYDHPGAKDDWAKQSQMQLPGIILSVHQVDLNNTIWIPKPLTSKALVEAATNIQQMVQVNTPKAFMTPEIEKKSAAHTVNSTSKQAEPAFQAKSPLVFGLGSASAKLRAIALDIDDEDEEETAPNTRVHATPSKAESVETVFDPAETDITMEEISRPMVPEISLEVAEQRWRDLCGEREDIRNIAHPQGEIALFNPDNYLIAALLEAVKRATHVHQPMQLKLADEHYLLILPELGQIFSTLDKNSNEFAMLCHNPIQGDKFSLHVPNAAEVQAYQVLMQEKPEKLDDLESFIWTSSLLTAKGRIPRGLDVMQKAALKSWPNMTRLEQFPHIMRIAALWSQRTGTPLEIASALDVPQRYVFSLYVAANNLNLVELDQAKLKTQEQTKTKEPPKENRGLFSRLLKRLLGGSAK